MGIEDIGKFPFYLKIFGYADIMLTMCLHTVFVFMDSSKISVDGPYLIVLQMTSFSNLKAIDSIVFVFVCHHFSKIYKTLNSETLTFSSH